MVIVRSRVARSGQYRNRFSFYFGNGRWLSKHTTIFLSSPMKRKDLAASGGAMGKLMADDCLRSKKKEKKKRRRDFFIGGSLSCSFHLTRKSWNRAKGVIISRRSFLSPPPPPTPYTYNQWISIALQLISENVMDVFFCAKWKSNDWKKGKTSF